MAFFGLRIDDELAARFDAVAAGVGGRSQALRALIERVSASQPASLPSDAIIPPSPRPNRVEIRLNDGDSDRLRFAASSKGMKRTDWIVALISSRLRAAPPPPLEHRQILIGVRRELRAIGKNVNQAVHAVHTANMQDSRLDLGREVERVASMAAAIDEQIAAIGAALKGDLDYWRAE
jgi:antitoxin component of RelBE/YafQ-DinJ toxin-antitoxin module